MKIKLPKALNPSYRKHKPVRSEVSHFLDALKECVEAVVLSDNKGESEEHLKEPLKKFFQNTFYQDHLINTKDRIDLAIYLDKTAKSDVGVIIEAKRPSNKAEFLSENNLNKKALQELLLYYLRERLDVQNNNIKHLIATNGYEWYLFKAEDFYHLFFKNKSLIKEYEAFRDGLKDSLKNELFYQEIAKKYIAEVQEELPYVHIDFTHVDWNTLEDVDLINYYKIFSNVHLLGHSFGNDSNQLNKSFYHELLHIIGLEETADKGKKVIQRKTPKARDYASLLENTIFILEDRDYIRQVRSVETSADKAFNVGLELCLTWINRILFLKLLESQLSTYHKGAKEYQFLHSGFIEGFDALNNLFFSALAKNIHERHPKYAEKFQYIPYLNSSLFERNELESETFEISALSDDAMEVYANTVLKDAQGKRRNGKLKTLDYLFQFLNAYDFATDGTEGIADGQESKTLINASVLGLIFEKINGYKDGSFYTPAYITMYMCKETIRRAVTQKFKELENDSIETFDDVKAYCHRFFKAEDTLRFNQHINSLRICDPAVGSGHFLVSALNELISIKNDLRILADHKGLPLRIDLQIDNDELFITDANGHLFEYQPHDAESNRIQKTLFHEKQTLIENCLFGVDINPNSVKICRLRLWIELLKNAYYIQDFNATTAKSATKNTTSMQLQTLPNIDINIKCGNSLIARFALDADLKQALKQSKWNIDSYKTAVATYRNAQSKDEKRAMEQLIADIKTNFRSEIGINDPKKLKLEKLRGEMFNLTQQVGLFERSKKEQTEWNKRVNTLAADIKKLDTEIEEIKSNKIYENAFEWRFEFPEVLNDAGDFVGFDVVIGNPPYMRVQEIQISQPMQKLHYENRYSNAVAAYDLANLFFENAINISAKSSNNSFIFPHKFFNSASSEVFRNYLKNGQYIDSIAHFGANMIFDDADTYTCVAQFSKKPSLGFSFQRFPFKSDFKNLMLDESKYTFITYEMIESASKLYGGNQWILFDDKLGFNVFEKIYKHSALISSKFQRVSQGIATGKDELYLFEGTLNDNYVVGNFIKDSKKRNIEKGILKPFYKGKDVQRYSSPKISLFILFPYSISEDGKSNILTEDEIKKSYPNAYKWLKETEAIHRKKDNKSTDDRFWYRYARNQGIDYIEFPKLSSMEICSKHPNVILNIENVYHSTTAYSWIKKNETKESYEYLLAIANSKLLWWFLKTTGDTLQGDARRFKTNYLNPFPLPEVVDENFESKISDKVNNVINLKKSNPDADTSALEREIDLMVYALYRLTEEEIEIVEKG